MYEFFLHWKEIKSIGRATFCRKENLNGTSISIRLHIGIGWWKVVQDINTGMKI